MPQPLQRSVFTCFLTQALLQVTLILAPNPDDCKRMLSLTDTQVTILTSEMIEAKERLPEHCRVVARILPAVHFEVRLPIDWNGNFYMVGNGGYLGMFFDQSYGLARGYATASTDTGHQGPDPTFAYNNRQAEIDFGFRAMHLSVLAAQRVIEAFYGSPPGYSYYRGCSTGGRQGLMEAQRFPDDFDGWSVGAPIYDYTEKQIYSAAWVSQALFGNDRAGYVPRRKLKALGEAVYGRCDTLDGLSDGLIEDPRKCDFQAERDLALCDGTEDRDDCFTVSQVEAISKIYAGPGEDLYPGSVKGGEWVEVPENQFGGGWDTYFIGMTSPKPKARSTIGQMQTDPYGGDEFRPVQLRNASSFFRFLAFQEDQPNFDVLTDLDFDSVPDTSFMAGIMNATDTDLSRLDKQGKKIILWHGWADVGLNPLRTIQYYEGVQRSLGVTETDSFMRLFMVPGMYHCSGGPGPDQFDDLTALENWVEKGVAPARIDAYQTRNRGDLAPDRKPSSAEQQSSVLRSRPLCPYPQVARYQGSGSIDRAENFKCQFPD